MPDSMRDRILAAAVSVLRERGVVQTTTKEIARAAGVAEGSIYNHFSGKTELIAACMAEVAGGIREALIRLSGRVGEGTIDDNLVELAEAEIAFYTDLLPITGPVLGDRTLREWLRTGGPRHPGEASTDESAPPGTRGRAVAAPGDESAARHGESAASHGPQQHADSTLTDGSGTAGPQWRLGSTPGDESQDHPGLPGYPDSPLGRESEKRHGAQRRAGSTPEEEPGTHPGTQRHPGAVPNDESAAHPGTHRYAEAIPSDESATHPGTRPQAGAAPGDESGLRPGPLLGHAMLTAYLEEERRAGRLAAYARPAYLAATIIGACQQYAFVRLLSTPEAMAGAGGLPADPTEYAREVVRTVMMGHHPRRARPH